MSLFVSQPPSHGVRNNDRSHSAPRFQSLGTQSKKMKRGRENSMPNPFLASKANTAARPSLPTCPREFLSSIPHPLPSGIGTQYLRSMRDIAAITGEAPPFMMRMLNARSSLPPFLFLSSFLSFLSLFIFFCFFGSLFDWLFIYFTIYI